MAKIEWVHQRLELWAEWIIRGRVSNDGLGFGSNPLAHEYEAPTNREPRAVIPLNGDECWATDQAIAKLEERQQRLVAEYYLNGSAAAADRLGLSRSSLSQWLSSAHLKLADLMHQERPRVALVERKPTTVERWFTSTEKPN